MLPAGSHLGPYEIVGPLGAGGMGEVYRARDARLRRDVALKVLPAVAAGDPQRRERFTREALAVAALNHPHIVTIHSVEDEGSTVFLTMELVEGRSLAEVLPPGGLSLERVLAIGIAVADAMAAAHQKGITHRDLKPGNIMLGEGEQAGRIKVLDFGLAKIVEPQVEAPSSLVPTEAVGNAAPITGEGRILGTVAYMSPEQAEGRPIDGRSDLFSLGVVLYEMATGQRPFAGDTNLSMLSSILKDTPRSVTDLNPALPRDLGRIARRALAKDPERRYQSAKDLRNDLEDLKASLDSGELAMQAATPVASSGPSQKNSRTLAAAAVLIVIVVAALVVLLRPDRQPASSESSAAPSSLADLQIAQLTTSGTAERPAISPDGRYVAYVQRDGNATSLWLRQTTTTNNVQIVAPEPGVTLYGATFSPDVTSVDYVRQPNGAPADIWRVPFLGGTPRRFISDVASSISWAPDGQRIAFLRTHAAPTLTTDLIVAAPDGGQERTLAARSGFGTIVSLTAPWRPNIPPAWSPDSALVAVVAAPGVVFVDSRTGSTHEVAVQTAVPYGLAWLDSESLVVNLQPQIGLGSQLFRLRHSGGPLSRLTNDPNNYIGLSVTSDRRSLVTSRRDALMDIWVGDAAASSGKDVVQRARVSVERVQWSGDRLVYGAVAGAKPGVFRLTPGEATPEVVLSDALAPAVTSDGSLVFVSSQDLALWKADANGRRIAQLTKTGTAEPVAVTPDDRFALHTALTDGTVAIWMVPLAGGAPTRVAVGTNVDASPDSQWVAFTAFEADGRLAVVVCRLPMCASRREIIRVSDSRAPVRWTPDGRGVAYAEQSNLWVQSIDGGPPRQLTRFTEGRPIMAFAWSRDGKRLAIARTSTTDDIVLIKGLN
jgi:serine/threonine protein kinase/WD40 repeat protein